MNNILLLRISEEKYIDQTQKDGKLYCNNLRYFRELVKDGYKADPNEVKVEDYHE